MFRSCVVFIAIYFFLPFNKAFSQDWTSNLPHKVESELTFYDYQNAFNAFWDKYEIQEGYYTDEEGRRRKAAGWKQFKRWEYFWEPRVDRETGAFRQLDSREMFEIYYKQERIGQRSTGSDDWTSLGPNSSSGGYAGVGRINCIAFHPSDSNIFWVGAASGGIWKTMDGGNTWTVLNNGTSVLAVSDIIIPSDYVSSNTIYIATGDRDGWDNNSIGVLKSTDGGSTWNMTDLNYPVANYKMVSRLLLDPTDDQSLLAATKDGIYKTTDGGLNWDLQLSVKEFTDIEYKPGDFTTLYGGTRDEGDLWISTDSGSTWTKTLSTNGKRVELAVSANDPNRVYALVSATNNGLLGVYRSDDSGASFTLVYDGTLSNQNMLGWYTNGSDSGGQGWYDLSLEANPDDADMVFVGGVNTWRSTDGGNTFAAVNCWTTYFVYNTTGVPEVHADKHKLRYRSNGDLFECNDGGVYLSTNDGSNWTDLTDGMTISQIYKLGVAQTVAQDVINGLQDNGTKSFSNGNWSDEIGGDGMDCAIDYTDEDTQYGELYYGDLKRTTNHWSSSTSIQPSGSSGAWVTPFVLDPVDPNTIYAGYEDIYKSTDQGSNWTSIYDLNSGSAFRSLAVAPSNTQVIYAGEPYTLWKTDDGGINWVDVSSGLSGSFITSIAVNSLDAQHLWVSHSTYSGNSVYESTDGGTSWTNISAGLPNVPVNTVIQNTQNNSQIDLFAATDNGVYFKGGSADWASFNNGLPNVVVSEVEIYYNSIDPTLSMIRAASYGRGLWESPIYYPVDVDQSKDLTFSEITTDQITVSWVNGSGTNRLVLISDDAGFVTPTDGTDPVANTQYGGGEQVIYNGAGAPVTVTDLDPSTTYYFRVFDYEGSGSGTVFNTALGINNPASCQTYCLPSSANMDDDYIARFILNTIDNSSGEDDYSDFSNLSTPLLPDNTYEISIEVGDFDEYLSLWIDTNDDQQFDANEKLISDFVCVKNVLTSTTFVLPQSTNYGDHLLRARVSYFSGADACSEVSYGEAEDYTVEYRAKNTWTGNFSSDWFMAANWDIGLVPTSDHEVMIPLVSNQPVINPLTYAFAKKVDMESGAELTIHGVLHID